MDSFDAGGIGRRRFLAGGLAVTLLAVAESCGGDAAGSTSAEPTIPQASAPSSADGGNLTPVATVDAAVTSVAPIETARTVDAIAMAADGIPELSLLSTGLLMAAKANVETLAGMGPVTGFAPTNDALIAAMQHFDALGKIPLTRAEATSLLNYSVIDGRHTAADLASLDGQEIPTRNGSTVKITVSGSIVHVNGVAVTTADIDASGNVIHIVDGVVLPPELTGGDASPPIPPGSGSVADAMASQLDLSVFTEGSKTFGVFDILASPQPLMVFVPVNAAFIASAEVFDPAGTTPTTGGDANALLMGHIGLDVRSLAELAGMNGESITSIFGTPLQITVSGADVFVNGAKVLRGDLLGSNGVVHVIDQVLIDAPS